MKSKIEKTIEIIEKYKKNGIIIDIKEPLAKVCSNRQDVAWYDGILATIENKKYKIIISASGELRGEYNRSGFETIKFRNPNQFYEYCFPLVKDDETLHSLIESEDPENAIILWNNNWIEFNIINKKSGERWDIEAFENICESNNILTEILDVNGYFHFIKENKAFYEGQA